MSGYRARHSYEWRAPMVHLTCGHLGNPPADVGRTRKHPALYCCTSCDGLFAAVPRRRYRRELPDDPEF